MSADPDGAHRAFRARPQTAASTGPPVVATPWPLPAELPITRQIRLLARREVRLLFANRAYLFFLAVLPVALAALTLLIPGDSGLDRPRAGSTNVHQAIEILAALNIAAVIVGTTLTIGALVRERRVFRREQALGLSASAYLATKIVVLGLAAAILTAVVFVIVVAVKGGPVHGAVLLHNATVELYVSVAVTAIVSAVVGLALSTLGKSAREVLPLIVPVVLLSVLFNGSLVPLVSKWVFQQISWFDPGPVGLRRLRVHRRPAPGRRARRRRRDVDALQRLVGVRPGDAHAVRCARGRIGPVSVAATRTRKAVTAHHIASSTNWVT